MTDGAESTGPHVTTRDFSGSRSTGEANEVKVSIDGPVLVLDGDFDVRSTWQVREALYRHLASCEEAEVVVDLAGVDSVDVSALKVLAAASLAAGRGGQALRLRGCGPGVLRMLHLSRLIRVVDLERTAASA